MEIGIPTKCDDPVDDISSRDNSDPIGVIEKEMEIGIPTKCDDPVDDISSRDNSDPIGVIEKEMEIGIPTKCDDPVDDISRRDNSDPIENVSQCSHIFFCKCHLMESPKLSFSVGNPNKIIKESKKCDQTDSDDVYSKRAKERLERYRKLKAYRLKREQEESEERMKSINFDNEDGGDAKANAGGSDPTEYTWPWHPFSTIFAWAYHGYPSTEGLEDMPRIAFTTDKRAVIEKMELHRAKKCSFRSGTDIKLDGSQNDIESQASSSNTKESFYGPPKKKSKPPKKVQFSNVTIYYFDRVQGFASVPTRGGCTLGMELKHNQMEILSVYEHAEEKKLVLKKSLANHRRIAKYQSAESDCDDNEDNDVDSESESASDTSGILKAVSIQQRRALLRDSGVTEIDSSEEEECRQLRKSRKSCGCKCTDSCDPNSCSCSQNGIKCQVDYKDFPCNCGSDCRNIAGRIVYSDVLVSAHFFQVTSKLDKVYPKKIIDETPLLSPEEKANLLRSKKCKYLEKSGSNVPFPLAYADNAPKHVGLKTCLEKFYKDEYYNDKRT